MKLFQELIFQKDGFLWALLLVLAAFCLYLPSETACAVAIPPDSSEYAIGLANLFEYGRFGFTLNGVWYPSRYAPWFSLSCLMPAYLLSGGNPLCFHWAILGFALAVLALMVKWGQRMGMGRWSFLSALILLFVPDFAFYSRIVMTEIPYVAIFAASALVWLRFVERGEQVSLKFCLGVGALVAWGGMVRPTMLPMIGLFAVVIWKRFAWRGRLLRWMALAAPATVYEGANFLYNKLTFGSFFRSGYQFWVPIPCDFPNLLFNWENVCSNAYQLLGLPIVQITLVMLLVSLLFALLVSKGFYGGMKQNEAFLLLLVYLSFQFCVLLALYGSYYWGDTRFYLAVTVCVIPLFCHSCWRLLDRLPFRMQPIVCIATLLFLGWGFSYARPYYRDQPYWRQMRLTKGKIASQVLPRDSVVIQWGDPNVLEYFCLKRCGQIHLPYQRYFDYTCYMVAPVSIRHLYCPASVFPTHIPTLVERGICQSPFPVTVVENPGYLKEILKEGKRVFIEQMIWHDKQVQEGVQKKLNGVGLTMKYFGGWEAPALTPNPVRHLYDKFVLGDCKMDGRDEVTAEFWEIVPVEDASR